MFLLPGRRVVINEVAPRPHNSGHYTMDACATSQFEQHLRAVLGWPLGEGHQLSGSAIMLNLLVRMPRAAAPSVPVATDAARGYRALQRAHRASRTRTRR
jgi:phosphoribosylaminoimidazole carboxylase (NCAIR synthetase)